MELDNLIARIKDFSRKSIKKSRFEHCLRTAELASRMGRLYNVDDMRCYFAGLAHDMCKNFDSSELLKLASRDGRPISVEEAENPSILHGRAAAVFLQESFGVTDAEVLQAVAMHVLGGRFLCPLAKIVFVADKIEPGRKWSGAEYLEEVLKMDLDSLTLMILKKNISFLHAEGKKEAACTKAFLEELGGKSDEL